MSEDKTPEKNKATSGKKFGIAAAVALVVCVALGATFFLSGNGIAEQAGKKATTAKAEAASQETPAAGETDSDTAQSDLPSIKLGDPVVAKVGEAEIKRSDVLSYITNLPERVRQLPIQNLFPLAQQQVVNDKLIELQSKEADLSGDEEVEKLVDEAKSQIVRNVYIQRQVEEKFDKRRVLKAYEDLIDQVEDIKEVKARHILVEDEEKAKELIKQLDEGADFADLAQEHSTGPTGPNGGDLGYFAEGQMVEAFSNAAFALEKGAYTKEPVQTQFGWHVILAEDQRSRPVPEFEDVKPQLEAQVRREILDELVQGWEKEAKIELFDINGEEPVAAEK